jgi:glycolate oxidase FAD binding subunit
MSAEHSCAIDGFGPVPVLRPSTPADVGEIVRRAAAEDRALYPLGGRTMLDVGRPPARPGYGVDLRSLNAVVDYPARDMTVTVQAGVTVADLQRTLAAENQRLPIDVPQADRATLGGALAVNVSGPRRYAQGALRDYVIGITTINDEGRETRAGGRVVKNVAGYDLCKLHVGALGTLGIISQVTLKLRPLPEARVLVTLGCDAAGLAPLLEWLHISRVRPSCIDVLNAAAAGVLAREAAVGLPESPWVVIVGFEENSAAVGWQIQQLVKGVPPDKVLGLEARAGGASDALWQALVEQTAPATAALSFKANLMPGAVAAFCHEASRWEELHLHAHAGSGIVRGHLYVPPALDRVRGMLDALHQSAAAARGNVVLPRCPLEWKATLPVWGRERGDLWLMRDVKNRLDPRRLFNPGRFVV